MIFMATKEFLRKLRQKYHLGEYKKGNARPARKRARAARSPKRVRNVVRMARRKRVSHRRGMLGGSGMSLAKTALIGVGAAHFAGYVPVNIPYKEEAVAAAVGYFLGGKIKGAAVAGGAALLAKMLANNGGSSAGTW